MYRCLKVCLHLYKGSSTAGTPAIIHSGEQFGIQEGYGIITVINPSMLIEGEVYMGNDWLIPGKV